MINGEKFKCHKVVGIELIFYLNDCHLLEIRNDSLKLQIFSGIVKKKPSGWRALNVQWKKKP
jgi:hypothetical protein